MTTPRIRSGVGQFSPRSKQGNPDPRLVLHSSHPCSPAPRPSRTPTPADAKASLPPASYSCGLPTDLVATSSPSTTGSSSDATASEMFDSVTVECRVSTASFERVKVDGEFKISAVATARSWMVSLFRGLRRSTALRFCASARACSSPLTTSPEFSVKLMSPTARSWGRAYVRRSSRALVPPQLATRS